LVKTVINLSAVFSKIEIILPRKGGHLHRHDGSRKLRDNENSNNTIKPDIFGRFIALRRARWLIWREPATKHCVLDKSVDGKTLLVFCATSSQIKPIKETLNDVWKGEIEIICASHYAGGG